MDVLEFTRVATCALYTSLGLVLVGALCYLLRWVLLDVGLTLMILVKVDKGLLL